MERGEWKYKHSWLKRNRSCWRQDEGHNIKMSLKDLKVFQGSLKLIPFLPGNSAFKPLCF